MPILITQNLAFSFFCLVDQTTPTFDIYSPSIGKSIVGHLDRRDHDEKLVVGDLPVLVLVRKAAYQRAKITYQSI